MPHKCVRCSTVYPNNSPELMRGCTCGSRVFLFLRDDHAASTTPVLLPSSSSVLPPVPSSSVLPPSTSKPPSAPEITDSKPSSLPSNPEVSSLPSPPSSVPASEYGWLEDELAFLSKDKPVSVDVDSVENLRILEKGAYEIDLPSLFKGEPLVIKSDQHVYYVKLPQPRT